MLWLGFVDFSCSCFNPLGQKESFKGIDCKGRTYVDIQNCLTLWTKLMLCGRSMIRYPDIYFNIKTAAGGRDWIEDTVQKVTYTHTPDHFHNKTHSFKSCYYGLLFFNSLPQHIAAWYENLFSQGNVMEGKVKLLPPGPASTQALSLTVF